MDSAIAGNPTGPVADERSRKLVTLASLIGTTVEWYDFFIYGTITGLVFNKQFFPSDDVFVSTMLAYTVYAVGFVTRPVGGILFGHFGDRIGRKPLLVITLLIMGISTFLVGLVPTYASIGVAAPLLLLFLRLLQGIGLGGEWGGAVLMSFEYAPRERRGFYACFPQVGLAIGLCLATGVVALLSSTLTDDAFQSWGWRVAFLISIVLVGVGLFVRLRILETPEFARVRDGRKIVAVPVGEVIRDYKKNVLLGWGARYIDGVVFNIYAVFTIAYLVGILHYDKTAILSSISIAAFVLIFTIPVFSRLSDRIGQADRLRLGRVRLRGGRLPADVGDALLGKPPGRGPGDRARAGGRLRAGVRPRGRAVLRALRHAGPLHGHIGRLPGVGNRLELDHAAGRDRAAQGQRRRAVVHRSLHRDRGADQRAEHLGDAQDVLRKKNGRRRGRPKSLPRRDD